MTVESSYEQLLQQLKKIFHLKSILQLLRWDEQVNLPPNSSDNRAAQIAAISEVLHAAETHPIIGKCLYALEAESGQLTLEQSTVVRETRKDYDRCIKLHSSFVAKKAEATSLSFKAWLDCRESGNFEHFAPHLQKQLDFAIEEAKLVGSHENPYDYWVDQHDPGLSSKFIEELFSDLKRDLLPLIGTILNSSIKPNPHILKEFPIDTQESFLREVISRLGFDFEAGRLDRSVHPFCGGDPNDMRITTRFNRDVPLDSLFSSIHETGHALYEQSLPKANIFNPLGQHIGMAVHESQSRLWENQVGRSKAFWKFWEARYRELFSDQLKNIDSDLLYLTINSVGQNPIRVDSDEVTYNLHIILRFELEKQLFDGSLRVEDLPEAWNKLSEEILGFTPKNEKEGVLQDVHWSGGHFGYFPSYCLGNMMAAQLWYTVKKEIPDLEDKFAEGNFKPLLNWLQSNIHHYGKQFDTYQIIEKVTGQRLSHKFLIEYLKDRYLPLYA